MIYYFDLLPGMRASVKEDARKKMMQDMLKNPPKTALQSWDSPKKIVDVKQENDGTIRTYIEGEKYPVRFYTVTENVWVVASIKRLFSLMLGSKVGIIVLVLGVGIWSKWLQFVFEANSLILKEEHWSQPVKEIRRVLKGIIDDNFVDLGSAILQNDMAYCYRMQDILGELNQENASQNPIREIKRLLDIYQEREILEKNKNIIKKIKGVVWLLRFKGLGIVRIILCDLNILEVKLSKEDRYWTNIQEGYSFGGLPLEERKKLMSVDAIELNIL